MLCPGGLTATPVLEERTPGQVRRLRRVVGRPAAEAGRRDRRGDRAAGLFVPPNGKPYALNLVNGVIYTATAQGCGGNPNNFYSFDLATKKVGNWAPGSGGMWPRTGRRSARTARSTPAAATATTTRSNRSTARR